MATAREQAREAAVKAGADLDIVYPAIEAASDVWEPLLRQLVEATDEAVHDTHDTEFAEAWYLAKEALDG